MRCKHCNSCDIWRVPERTGLRAFIGRLRNQKPFQCRACGWVFYNAMRWIAPRNSGRSVAA